MTHTYKIEEWKSEFGHTFFVAFVRIGWLRKTWQEVGRFQTRKEAEEGLRFEARPVNGPWFYTATDL